MDEMVKYTAEGLADFQVRIDKDTVWLLEKESNMHFLHIANVDKPVAFYSLDVIISVGYRVKSQRGAQFRIWATKVLKEYLLKGASIQHPASKKEKEYILIF
jgi:hypothetical protein